MAKNYPFIDPSQEVYIVPDTQTGAWANCFCADCQEARLVDDERIFYTAHEMADAWTDGYRRGTYSTAQRLRDTIEDWMNGDE